MRLGFASRGIVEHDQRRVVGVNCRDFESRKGLNGARLVESVREVGRHQSECDEWRDHVRWAVEHGAIELGNVGRVPQVVHVGMGHEHKVHFTKGTEVFLEHLWCFGAGADPRIDDDVFAARTGHAKASLAEPQKLGFAGTGSRSALRP